MELSTDVPTEWKNSHNGKQTKTDKGQRKQHCKRNSVNSAGDSEENITVCTDDIVNVSEDTKLPIKRLYTVQTSSRKKKKQNDGSVVSSVMGDAQIVSDEDDESNIFKKEAHNDKPLCAEILRNLQRDYGEPIQEYLEVDSLICRLPYKKMLTSLCNRDDKCNVSDIPYVTRAYEESFMHEVITKDQRQCARGSMCECMFIDKANPFICIEFMLPGEAPGQEPNLCVVCCRAITQQLYYDIMFENQVFTGSIQRFGNLHSQEGEYALHAMLIASPSAPAHLLPLPIVAHQRNRYQVILRGGVRYLKQNRVYFQITPSC